MALKTSRLLLSSFLFILTPIFLTACSSSETADSGIGSGTSLATGVETGDVTLLLTDAPTSAYDEVNVVAESVMLVGEGPDAHLMKRPAKFNLLDLRNTFRRLSKTKAPVGTYSKVRFRIRDVELVKYKANGLVEKAYPRLMSNEINLNARTQFAVDRLRQLIVKLDLDADASLGTDPTAVDPDTNPDGTVFDPEATVEVESVPTDTTEPPQAVTPVLMNEQGVARNLLADSFQLCDPAQLQECVQVNVSPDTVFMDSQLQAGGIEKIAENFTVRVLGHLDVTTDTINALHVLQDSSRLNTYTGTFSSDVVNDAISFDVPAGDTTVTTYSVALGSLPGIYDAAGNALDASTLGNGVNAEVIGTALNPFQPLMITPGVIIIPNP
ncbi:MAG: DUF4382 domain-containing protein [Thiotrichales bacterium]|nr:MAG: DUF4382 domain-containing protein [Thiotrichales bacterium]